MHQDTVEFVAPPGFAAMEEQASLKLSMHMHAISSVLLYTHRVCQSQLKHRRFQFPAIGDVRVEHGSDSTDIIVNGNGCKVVYQYAYRHGSVSQCIRHNAEGVAQDSDLSTIQATYEAILTYCGLIIADRVNQKDVAPKEPVEPTTEAN